MNTHAQAPGGLIDFAVVFPRGRITVQKMHEMSGLSIPEIMEITHCSEFPVLGPDEPAWALAVDAASAVLDRTNTDVDAINRVIYVGSGMWDAPAWSPAAKAADELGITRAHCFELTNFCNAFPLGVRVAVDGLVSGTDHRVLVLAAERFGDSVDRRDPESKGLFNFGDAAVAALVGVTGFSFAFLGSTARTDPEWADYYVGDVHDAGAYFRRRGRRKGLADAYIGNYVALVEQTLGQIGAKLSDVRYLLVNQNDRNIQERLLAALDVTAERSVFQHDRLGHMGCTDTLIALRGLVDQAMLRRGDLVLLATSGMGFSWSVTALEFRAG